MDSSFLTNSFLNSYLYFSFGAIAMFFLVVGVTILIVYGRRNGHFQIAIIALYWFLLHLLGIPIVYYHLADSIWQQLVYSLCCINVALFCFGVRAILFPRWYTHRKALGHTLPFLMFSAALALSQNIVVLYCEMAYTFVFFLICSFAGFRGIKKRESLIMQYVSNIQRIDAHWAKVFMIVLGVAYLVWVAVVLDGGFWPAHFYNYLSFCLWSIFLYNAVKQKYVKMSERDEKILQKAAQTLTEVCIEKAEKRLMTELKPMPATPPAPTLQEEETDETENEGDKDAASIISTDTYDFIDEKVCELMDTKKLFLDPNLTLIGLAKLTSTNRTYMSLYFRSKGLTFWDYINRMRCEYSIKTMKQNPELNMAVIAKMCGYNSENRFRTSFAVFYNMSPFMYRKRYLCPADATETVVEAS